MEYSLANKFAESHNKGHSLLGKHFQLEWGFQTFFPLYMWPNGGEKVRRMKITVSITRLLTNTKALIVVCPIYMELNGCCRLFRASSRLSCHWQRYCLSLQKFRCPTLAVFSTSWHSVLWTISVDRSVLLWSLLVICVSLCRVELSKHLSAGPFV